MKACQDTFYVASKYVKVDIEVTEQYRVKMKFYLLDDSILPSTLKYCDDSAPNKDDLVPFIKDFISYIEEKNTTIDFPPITTNSYCPYSQIKELGLDLGYLEYPMKDLKALGYVEEQYITWDLKYEKRITALTVLHCLGISLVRKAMQWHDITWCSKEYL